MLENLATLFAEETEDSLTWYEIRLIDAGASDGARVLLAKYGRKLKAEARRVMFEIVTWLKTNPQPGE